MFARKSKTSFNTPADSTPPPGVADDPVVRNWSLTAHRIQLGAMLGVTVTASVTNAFGVLGPSASVALLGAGLSVLLSHSIRHDNAAEKAAREQKSAGERHTRAVERMTRALEAARTPDITARPNAPETFAQATRLMQSLYNGFSLEASCSPDGGIVLNGTAIHSIVRTRCTLAAPVHWEIALDWTSGEGPGGEARLRARRRAIAVLTGIAHVAATVPGCTTAHITVILIERPTADTRTQMLTHHAELDCPCLIEYHADANGLVPGRREKPRDVQLDPRPHYVGLFRDRWKRTTDGCDRLTLDQFRALATPLLDCPVKIEQPPRREDIVAWDDHIGNLIPRLDQIHPPVAPECGARATG